MGRSEGLTRRWTGQVLPRRSIKKLLSGREIQRRVTEFQPKKEPCLTPTLMDEGQAKKPYTT